MQPELLKDVMSLLCAVQRDITPAQFFELFGADGWRLWRRFVDGGFNAPELYARLDAGKKDIFCRYLSAYNPAAAAGGVTERADNSR